MLPGQRGALARSNAKPEQSPRINFLFEQKSVLICFPNGIFLENFFHSANSRFVFTFRKGIFPTWQMDIKSTSPSATPTTCKKMNETYEVRNVVAILTYVNDKCGEW